jgi:hypothetical protein
MTAVPVHKRLLVTGVDGAGYVRLLAVAGIITVLATRAYLAATGYPQVGGGTLHVAHALWGGLLMLAGLMSALVSAGRTARVLAAVLGGAGFGLFVDEIGKFLTRSNDYFFRPAAAIIYLVFAGLLVLSFRLRNRRPQDPGHRLTNAAQIATNGLISGLTPDQRQAALHLLEGRDDQAAQAIRELLDAAPVRDHPTPARRLARRTALIAARLADQPILTTTVIVLFAFSQLVTAIVFITQGTGNTTVAVGAVTRAVAAAITVTGLIKLRHDRLCAYQWFKAGLLIDLLITQVLSFDDSQFAAVAELPFNLLALAILSLTMRRASLGRWHADGQRALT